MLKLKLTNESPALIAKLAELTGQTPEVIIEEHLKAAIDRLIESDIKGDQTATSDSIIDLSGK